jgi:large subunit ribosomal protein L6
MSRIGKLPISVPTGVTITVDQSNITVAGPKGTLSQPTLPEVTVENKDGVVTVTRNAEEARNRAMHGLMRTLINNMVVGVTEGYSKQLELNGVGYRVAIVGNGLKLNVGFSHEVNFTLPTGITATVEQNIITISGINKQAVGQVAADIRKLKKPEPYKGKGIKYVGERILRKSGKSGKEK